MKKDFIAVLIICIILVVISVPIGLYMGKFSEHWISETYFKNFTLAKDVVFDEPEIIEFYGGPVKYPAGMKGSIVESISGGVEVKGYEYINIHIHSENGTVVDAAISIDPDSEKGIYTLEGDIYGVVVVFSLKDIEDSQTILDEYEELHERYYSRAKTARTVSLVTSVAVSLILSVAVCLVNANRIKKAED
ncbi:MAG: hypothetical protein K5881_03100 [Saccharofermentans sp.]|nr:hypothetical protein [Saccharofermentans sp.]